MIAQIDAARQRHNDAIGAALAALNELAQLVDFPEAVFLARQYCEAIDSANLAADAGITGAMSAPDDPEAQTVIHVGGDYIHVDGIVDSQNIVIGKDIGQTVSEK